MTERDAFGNPIQPTSPSATPRPASVPSPTPAPAPASPAASTASPTPGPTPISLGPGLPTIQTYGPSKTSWWERLAGFGIFLVFAAPLAIGGFVAYNAFGTAKDAVDSVSSIKSVVSGHATTTSTETGSTGAGAKPAAPPAGVAGTSLLKATNLKRALASARRDPGGRLTLLRVAPERADLQLARRGGGLHLVQVRADGGTTRITSPGTPSRTIGFARVDTKAPARLVRQAAHRLGRSTKSIDYVVLVNFPGLGPQWSAYFKGGAAFAGDDHGRITRRIQ